MKVKLDRIVCLAPAEQGKTTLLRRIVQSYRTGGVIFDPLRELEAVAGVRWELIQTPRIDLCSEEELDGIIGLLEGLEPGAAVIGDEFSRWLPRAWDSNPLLQLFDVLRNQGVRWAIAEKRPQRLHALTPDLADTFLWRSWRSKSARQWIEGAGLDSELPPPPPFNWYAINTGADDFTMLTTEEIELNFGFSIDKEPVQV